MEEVRIIKLDKNNAAPFAPYFLPQVRYDLGAGEDIVALGAVQGNSAVGAVAASVEGTTLNILSLYVDTAVRRQGIGTKLMEAIAGEVAQHEEYIEQLRTEYMVDDENGEVIAAFLRSMDFEEPQATNRLFSVDTAKLHHLPVLGEAFSANFKEDPHVRPFADVAPSQLAEIEADESVPPYLKPSAMHRGILRQAATVWVEDGHVLAWILGYQGFDGEIVMSVACKRAGAPKGSFRKLLQASANRCYLMLGHDFTAYIATINEHSGSLVEKLAGGVQKEYRHYTAVLNIPQD